MKTYTFKIPFQGNRKGDTVTEDKYGQLLVKAGSNNVMWGPKDIFRAKGMGMIEDTHSIERARGLTGIPARMLGGTPIGTGVSSMVLFCNHSKAIRENDEMYCPNCNKRWEAGE